MTELVQRLRSVRDDRAPRHQSALDSGSAGGLVGELMTTSVTAANLVAWNFGMLGSYDHNRTVDYLREMAYGQVAGRADAVSSAGAAMNFGMREFAYQNLGRRRWTLTWVHFPSAKPRESHVNAAGTTIPLGDTFGVEPPMSCPHCGCLAVLGVG